MSVSCGPCQMLRSNCTGRDVSVCFIQLYAARKLLLLSVSLPRLQTMIEGWLNCISTLCWLRSMICLANSGCATGVDWSLLYWKAWLSWLASAVT